MPKSSGSFWMRLASLNKLPQLHTAVTENRKYGNPVVLGFQGRSQMESHFRVVASRAEHLRKRDLFESFPLELQRMRCTQISAFSFQLTRLGLINCYLVRQSKGDSKTAAFTLIDTGMPGTGDDILAEATRAGAPIDEIALTHAHDDHVGSADALLGKLKIGTPLAASERSIPLLQKPPNKEHEPYEGKEESLEFLSGIQSRVTHTLSDGELYGALRVIETPGHMAGHLSFLDERDGTLFAGDALIGVGRLSVSGYSPWYAALPNFATWDKAAAVASVGRLLEYPIKRIACGHGPFYEGGRELLQEALTRASRHR